MIDNNIQEILKICSYLLKYGPLEGLSSFSEDMPKTTPKIVLERISMAEDRLVYVACELKRICDDLRKINEDK